MASEVGKNGPGSGGIGGQVEGGHSSIGVGSGAPSNGGDGRQSLKSPTGSYESPCKDVNSGEEGVPTV